MRFKRRQALVAFIQRALPEGNIFGTRDSDEFSVIVDGRHQGVFKRFEYLSLPFSITGKQEKFKELLRHAEQNGTSFAEELAKDSAAQNTVNNVFNQLAAKPAFARQVLDTLLSDVYIKDNLIARTECGAALEEVIAKVVVCWKQLADFYCIEGLVGGGGERNPFTNEDAASFAAGGLDSLESVLPSLKEQVSSLEWVELCLKLSSVIGRDHAQIDSAVDVLAHVFGKKKSSPDEIDQAKQVIDDLAQLEFTTTGEIGKFFNSFIRFHNWLPLALKHTDPPGDVYDSICVPAKKAVSLAQNHEVAKSINYITDATSPKGLAFAMLIDERKIGNRDLFVRNVQELENRLVDHTGKSTEFFTFTLDDHAFSPALGGGKWKGLKLLHDTKEALGLTYSVPKALLISSVYINHLLQINEITDGLHQDIFTLDEQRRQEIVNRLSSMPTPSITGAESVGESLIVRSSMYGEDGLSNFSGTYNSVKCTKENVGEAIREVMLSYFSREAIKSREDVGLAHIPGISMFVQAWTEGSGGVFHASRNEASISIGETPEEAVLGNGASKTASSVEDCLSGTPLEGISADIATLYRLFGDLDIEFVIDYAGQITLTQLRKKYTQTTPTTVECVGRRKIITDIADLPSTFLEDNVIVRLDFLGTENVMHAQDAIMDFIRRNRNYIIAVEGRMPCVAHIPNKIEGHFRIPYRRVVE